MWRIKCIKRFKRSMNIDKYFITQIAQQKKSEVLSWICSINLNQNMVRVYSRMQQIISWEWETVREWGIIWSTGDSCNTVIVSKKITVYSPNIPNKNNSKSLLLSVYKSTQWTLTSNCIISSTLNTIPISIPFLSSSRDHKILPRFSVLYTWCDKVKILHKHCSLTVENCASNCLKAIIWFKSIYVLLKA